MLFCQSGRKIEIIIYNAQNIWHEKKRINMTSRVRQKACLILHSVIADGI